jgi:hypothetical protein
MMLPVAQRPGDNCLTACLASLLGLPIEDVPDPGPDDPWRLPRLRDGLRERGWDLLVVDELATRPAGYWIACHTDDRGRTHAVVWADDNPVWDPGQRSHDYGPVTTGLVLAPLDPGGCLVLTERTS